MYYGNLPIIRHNKNLFSVGGNMFFMGGMNSPTGQFMSKNQGALAGGADFISQGVDALTPENSIGGGAAKGALKGASAGMFLGPWGALAGGVIGGGLGAITAKKDQDRADYAAQQESMNAYGRSRSNVDPSSNGVYAQGGELPGITQFNEGGSHEANQLGGIPQGISSQNGQPNLVEQGETKVKDFIYSARGLVMNPAAYNLPTKYNGKSFADASKLASKYREERPNDPIAQKGQETVLNRLKQANEDYIKVKEYEQQSPMQQVPNQAMCGGKLKNVYSSGGFTFTDY